MHNLTFSHPTFFSAEREKIFQCELNRSGVNGDSEEDNKDDDNNDNDIDNDEENDIVPNCGKGLRLPRKYGRVPLCRLSRVSTESRKTVPEFQLTIAFSLMQS